jgi:hypothetical protein
MAFIGGLVALIFLERRGAANPGRRKRPTTVRGSGGRCAVFEVVATA